MPPASSASDSWILIGLHDPHPELLAGVTPPPQVTLRPATECASTGSRLISIAGLGIGADQQTAKAYLGPRLRRLLRHRHPVVRRAAPPRVPAGPSASFDGSAPTNLHRMTMVARIDERLRTLTIELPNPASSGANYVPFVRTGNLVF